jgi:hypothetical protein
MDMAILLHDGLAGPPDSRSAMFSFHDTTRSLPSGEHQGHDGGSRRVFTCACTLPQAQVQAVFVA